MLQNQCACVCVSRRGIMLAGYFHVCEHCACMRSWPGRKGDDGLIYFKVGGVSTSGVKVCPDHKCLLVY